MLENPVCVPCAGYRTTGLSLDAAHEAALHGRPSWYGSTDRSAAL
jgi:hypothetical protein